MFNLAAIYKYKLSQPEKAQALLEKLTTLPQADAGTKERAKEELGRPGPTGGTQ